MWCAAAPAPLLEWSAAALPVSLAGPWPSARLLLPLRGSGRRRQASTLWSLVVHTSCAQLVSCLKMPARIVIRGALDPEMYLCRVDLCGIDTRRPHVWFPLEPQRGQPWFCSSPVHTLCSCLCCFTRGFQKFHLYLISVSRSAFCFS